MPADSTLGDARFPTTRWSALVGARSREEPERRRSWEALVAAYWKPVYKHVRIKWRKARDDARDLTQAFFLRAMERDFFAAYDDERARFRTFMRVCLDRFVGNEHQAERRLKRGGGARLLSLDFDAADAEIEVAAHTASPEDGFDREWRRSLFTLAVEALRAECIDEKAVRFVVFERYDLCDGDERPSYADLGRDLGLPVTTVTNHLAWARRELRRLVLERLAEVSPSEREYEGEARRLWGAKK